MIEVTQFISNTKFIKPLITLHKKTATSCCTMAKELNNRSIFISVYTLQIKYGIISLIFIIAITKENSKLKQKSQGFNCCSLLLCILMSGASKKKFKSEQKMQDIILTSVIKWKFGALTSSSAYSGQPLVLMFSFIQRCESKWRDVTKNQGSLEHLALMVQGFCCPEHREKRCCSCQESMSAVWQHESRQWVLLSRMKEVLSLLNPERCKPGHVTQDPFWKVMLSLWQFNRPCDLTLMFLKNVEICCWILLVL